MTGTLVSAAELRTLLRPGSGGAGPAVLFGSHLEQTGALLDALRAEAPDCEVRRVQFDPSGADVRALA